MRPRFNRAIVASSDAYKVHSHRRLLQENHKNNEVLLLTIANNTTIKPKSDIELFEEGLKRQIEQYKKAKSNERKDINIFNNSINCN